MLSCKNPRQQIICIRPKDKESQRNFWLFRCKQASDTLPAMTILHFVIFVAEVLTDVFTETVVSRRLFIICLWPLVDILYYLMSRKYKGIFAYFLPLYVLLLNLVTMWFYLERVKDSGGDQTKIEEHVFFCVVMSTIDCMFAASLIATSIWLSILIGFATIFLQAVIAETIWISYLTEENVVNVISISFISSVVCFMIGFFIFVVL